jgi:hypothetical protein
VAVQETGDQDGVHGAEDISWIVVETGSWVLADGTVIEAGLAEIGAPVRQSFTSLSFKASFAAGPAVLTQTQTANDADFVQTRMQGVDAGGFSVGLEEEEAAARGVHGVEGVGWIALDMGAASDADGFVFEAGEISANQKWGTEIFGAGLDAPGVVAGMASYNGADAAAARLGAITDQGFQIRAEEDQTHDTETFHAREDFHWIAFNQGEIWGCALV